MAEGRFLSKSIATSGQLKRVSLEADYLFTRCIPHLDRDGRLDGDPDIVKAIACPLRPELTTEVIAKGLAELHAEGLIEWYEVGAQKVVWFPTFRDHQRGMKPERERPSRLPANDAEGARHLVCRTSPVQLREDSAEPADKLPPREVKRSEVKGSASEPWRAEGAAWWRSKVGHVTDAQFGRALSPIVALHGWDGTHAGLAEWVDERKRLNRDVNLKWFVSDSTRWIEQAAMPTTDEHGDLTPRGKRIAGIAA